MRLPEICIRQPVLAIVLNLVLVVLGIAGYRYLEVRFFPDLHELKATVSTSYTGASASLMENAITTKIEGAIAGVDDVESVDSTSQDGSSTINVYFKPGSDFDADLSQLRDKVSSVDDLPTDADPPTVSSARLSLPIMSILVSDQSRNISQVRDYVLRNITPVLNQVSGVGGISVAGGSGYAMRIWLNEKKMAALGVTVSQVKSAIADNNIDFSAGRIYGKNRRFSIVSDTQLKSASALANTIVVVKGNRTIRMKNIAKVELGHKSLHFEPFRANGKSSIMLNIKPLRDANPIAVAKRVRGAFARVQHSLPQGMHASIMYDQSVFLKASVDEAYWAMVEAIALVVLVVFLFLGSIRASLIPIITIPVCIVAVFMVMKLFGFTINVLSLLAIVLSIGLVVDDAIVMLENIYRYIEQGMSPLDAALKGSKEIAFAVVAMTITLAAVYAPIGLIQGYSSELFKEFAFTLAGSVVISGFVALTLSPMMCSQILVHETDNRLVNWLEQQFEAIAVWYRHGLTLILRYRYWVLIGLTIIAAFGYLIFQSMPSEFMPTEDAGLVMVTATSPPNSNLAYTNYYAQITEQALMKNAHIATVGLDVDPSDFSMPVVLVPWEKRGISAEQVAEKITPLLDAIPGVDAHADVPDLVGDGGRDMVVRLSTTGNYQDLQRPVNQLLTLMQHYPGFRSISTNLKYDQQQYQITINRDLAANLGVSVPDIASTFQAMLGSVHVTDVQAGLKSYPVMLQMQASSLESLQAIDQLYVPSTHTTPSGAPELIPLSTLVKLTPTVGQPSLAHYNRLRSANVAASLTPGFTESQAVQYIQRVLPTILTPNVHYAFGGKAKQLLDQSGNVAGIFLLALVFIYLVLSAQFGSFIDPFIILFSVPLSIVGALFTLKITGGTINLYSEIGFVTLIGLISKHGILITQFINQLREEGHSLIESIVQGASVRLRPILMTTFAMVFGTLPLAFATGPGSVGREQIGWVIVGGLSFGTFFSLVVVPIAYLFFAQLREKINGSRARL